MKYKEFELIGSSFKCDKNCPYCTAKITQWPVVDNKLEVLEDRLNYLKNNDVTFRYFIFCGNGEPSLLDFEDFKKIVEATRNVNIFDEKRLQSYGNIFYEDEKLDLIKYRKMILKNKDMIYLAKKKTIQNNSKNTIISNESNFIFN